MVELEKLHAGDDEPESDTSGFSFGELVWITFPRWKIIITSAAACGLVGLAVSFLIPPTYTGRISFLSPQQQQNSAAAALASLGALSGLAGVATGIKSPVDQYISLLQSETIADRIIDRFKLMEVYEVEYRVDARRDLAKYTRVSAGKKDNLLSVEVDDHDRMRAADMANAYVQELKQLSNGLSLTEAQQRRSFFELQLTQTRDKLATAQAALQKSGFSQGLIKSEPKAAAETYARTKAEIAGIEVRINTLRSNLTESAPEVRQQLATLVGLKAQLAKLEQPLDRLGDEDYVGAYREFKYQEAMFEVFSRQFELAKLDESREGTLFQIIDIAKAPERKSKPKRTYIAVGSTVAGFSIAWLWFVASYFRRSRQRVS